MNYPEKIQCKKCGEFKTHEHFYWNKNNSLNQYKCKECYINKKIFKKECVVCNKLFETNQPNRKYCSAICRNNFSNFFIPESDILKVRNKGYANIYIKNCENCNKSIIVRQSSKNKRFCSQDCRLKYEAYHLTDYYIKTLLTTHNVFKSKNITNEIIKSKRDIIKSKRLLKQLKTKLNDKLESGKQ